MSCIRGKERECVPLSQARWTMVFMVPPMSKKMSGCSMVFRILLTADSFPASIAPLTSFLSTALLTP